MDAGWRHAPVVRPAGQLGPAQLRRRTARANRLSGNRALAANAFADPDPTAHTHQQETSMTLKFTRYGIPVAAAIIGIAPLLALPAQATYPSDNGRIAFRRYFTPNMDHGAVFTINPDGTGEFQVT